MTAKLENVRIFKENLWTEAIFLPLNPQPCDLSGVAASGHRCSRDWLFLCIWMGVNRRNVWGCGAAGLSGTAHNAAFDCVLCDHWHHYTDWLESADTGAHRSWQGTRSECKNHFVVRTPYTLGACVCVNGASSPGLCGADGEVKLQPGMTPAHSLLWAERIMLKSFITVRPSH